MTKLNDFARQMGVTERAIQKHLKKYASELEGTFERKGPNGTWLSDEACEFLRSKMKQAPVVVASDPSEREAALQKENEALKVELFKVQQKYTDYVAGTTEMLQAASKQLALAEASEENKKRADALEGENARLNADVAQRDETIAKREAELEAERNRRITFREFLRRRRSGK